MWFFQAVGFLACLAGAGYALVWLMVKSLDFIVEIKRHKDYAKLKASLDEEVQCSIKLRSEVWSLKAEIERLKESGPYR